MSEDKPHSKQTGDLAESKFISRCLEKGYSISKPFGENQRYDLIVDRNGYLIKVQVKASWTDDGGETIRFPTCSHNQHNGRKTYTSDQVDVFGVYSRIQDQCYWVPFKDAPDTSMKLRIKPPKNGQTQGVNWAEDYIF